ncbi:glucose-1-phosphate thymidylyltransferase [Candidatus Methanomethylophilus sp. 1R26]|uniref:glucose-1-phosphate thymidylyltransferase RfbA n=1 Tax=Candidatus Methanomethylophilus sp. 1R26 TaxID=1769296 RepID=UPI00073788A8|nr:glucose-1-phosphate thymidylyltransferase [Candidatus Methanomethylophilus sp. 1R26]
MKGIIMAAGRGTRLYPASQHISKILLPIYDKPMVYYPLSALMSAGITEILMIVSKDDRAYFKRLLGDGSQFGIEIKFAVQKTRRGIADAFILGEKFIGGGNVALALGDNIFCGDEMDELLAEAMSNDGATIFCKKVEDPERFGVAEFDKDGKVLSLEEKPAEPKSNMAVTGLYFYDKDVVKYAKMVSPSARGELEITDINRMYMKAGKLKTIVLPDSVAWADTGTCDTMLEAGNYVHDTERTGRALVGCPEQVALNRGYITKKQLLQWVSKFKETPYYSFLRDLAQSERF